MLAWFSGSNKNVEYELLHKQFTNLLAEIFRLNENSSVDLIENIKLRVFSHDMERSRKEENFSMRQKATFRHEGKTLAEHFALKLAELKKHKSIRPVSRSIKHRRQASEARWNLRHASSDSEDLMSGSESKSSGSRLKPKLKQKPKRKLAPRRKVGSDSDTMESPAKVDTAAVVPNRFSVGKALGASFQTFNMDTESEGSSSDSDTAMPDSRQLFGM